MENLPPGFRFHPTDEELVTYYLSRKISDLSFMPTIITDVDFNKCEPWDLPGKGCIVGKEWYFFSLRDRKYPTGLRTNRATDAGYWKTTGKDKEIFQSGVLVGLKKTLVFYKGRAPKGEKSNWVMHEYRLETKFSIKSCKDEWVVCRVFEKSSAAKKLQQAQSLPASLESPYSTTVNELGEIENLNYSTEFSTINSNNTRSNNVNTGWNISPGETTNHPLLSWPNPTLLTSNLTMNSMLLKALQFQSNHLREATSGSNLNMFAPQGSYGFGTDLTTNLITSNSKNLDSVHDEQAFNLNSYV
ncbi:hypothetical protein GIB67_012653 [Kingdonia uniflora]|uniref:NAC domain-containing protein n=1 Tax=Kingdonia uniflora TaxID=39325 RepID=A0A7J7NEZ4_9MAGN|nr:hypothetical protein GIB67_012653 [Kingdonia uniflora]